MSVWYLELDDEITDAVARLRAARDERVVLVVPPGSRIGTGRINFRLLAREAASRGLAIAVVSGDAQVRALAASAGLAVYATVAGSEAAEAVAGDASAAAGVAAASGGGEAASIAVPAVSPAIATLTTAPGPSGAAAVVMPGSRSARDDRTRTPTIARRPRSRRAMAVVGGGLALVTLLGGGALYNVYATSTATIGLVLTAHPVAPVDLTLVVDPDRPTDAATGVVQGQWRPVPVSVSGTVIAHGSTPLVTTAVGTVTFANHSTNPIPIPEETLVSTPAGVAFRTQTLVQVPAGGTADVPVRAVQSGQGGNVPAFAITRMDPLLADSLSSGTVVNKEATTGGDSVEQPIIVQADYDSTLSALTNQIDDALATAAAEPVSLPPGLVAYPETVVPGDLVLSPQNVVGQPVASMGLTASMVGSVLTASRADLERVATGMFHSSVPPGTDLVEPSISVDLGTAALQDGLVTYHATASGQAFNQSVDPVAVKESVLGRPRSEAQGILEDLGTTTITMSPDFMPNLPDDPNRILLNITTPPEGPAQ